MAVNTTPSVYSRGLYSTIVYLFTSLSPINKEGLVQPLNVQICCIILTVILSLCAVNMSRFRVYEFEFERRVVSAVSIDWYALKSNSPNNLLVQFF